MDAEYAELTESRMEKGLIVMYRRSNGTRGSQWVLTPSDQVSYAELFNEVVNRIDKEYTNSEYAITNVIKL